MTLYEFLQTATLTAVEMVDKTTLINVVVNGEELYGLNIDTSNIPSGIKLVHITDFVLDDAFLSVDGIVFDTRTLNLLSE
jgi:hypothetical protein